MNLFFAGRIEFCVYLTATSRPVLLIEVKLHNKAAELQVCSVLLDCWNTHNIWTLLKQRLQLLEGGHRS